MQEYLGLLVAVARRRLKQAVLARLNRRRIGLSVQQFWMLAALRECPGLPQSAIAGRLRADAPTVSRTLSALARKRLVRGAPDPADRRRTCVWLTAQGERVAAELAPVVDEIREAVVAGMSASEIAALRQGLQQIIANLEALAGVDAPGAERDLDREVPGA